MPSVRVRYRLFAALLLVLFAGDALGAGRRWGGGGGCSGRPAPMPTTRLPAFKPPTMPLPHFERPPVPVPVLVPLVPASKVPSVPAPVPAARVPSLDPLKTLASAKDYPKLLGTLERNLAHPELHAEAAALLHGMHPPVGKLVLLGECRKAMEGKSALGALVEAETLPTSVGTGLKREAAFASLEKELGNARMASASASDLRSWAKTAGGEELADGLLWSLASKAKKEGQPELAGKLIPEGKALADMPPVFRDLKPAAKPAPPRAPGELVPEGAAGSYVPPVRESALAGLPAIGKQAVDARAANRAATLAAVEREIGSTHSQLASALARAHERWPGRPGDASEDEETVVERRLRRALSPVERTLLSQMLRAGRAPAECADDLARLSK